MEALKAADDSNEDPTGAYKWREDVLEKVMAEHGIEDRDAFIAHAVKFDHDNNMYLKKVELTDAAKSFVEQSSEDSEDSEADDSAESEDSGEAADGSDEEAESTDSESSETKPALFVEQRMLQTLVHVLHVTSNSTDFKARLSKI